MTNLRPLSEHAAERGLSRETLRLAAASGSLSAVRLGRNWFATDQAVNDWAARPKSKGGRPRNP